MNKKLSKKIIAMALCGVLATATMLTGCGSNNGSSSAASSKSSSSQSASSATAQDATSAPIDILSTTKKDAVVYEDKEHKVGYQLDKPAVGEQVAIIHTSMGDVSLRLFPEAAPKTVENFVTHAKDGYYDNLTFHRIIDGFMIQGGDPNGTGTGGESIWGDSFEDEFSDHLFNIRGAVAMANSGKDTNGSQFFIDQGDADKFKENGGWTNYEAQWTQAYGMLSKYYGTESYDSFIAQYGSYCMDTDLISEDIRKLYEENGGNPTLDGAFNATDKGHTVFAQVYEGIDVVDKIAAVETSASTNKPTTDVIIKNIEITTYSE